jgi:hypothetical protein
MKSLRISALMLALGAFSICSVPAHAQQEVDPDHFDQPNTLWTHARGSKTQGHRDVTATQHRTNKKLARVASRKAHYPQNARQASGSKDIPDGD